MLSYKGKNVIVTGASSGIGIEFALQLATLGARPILVARREERMQQLAKAIKEQCDIEAPVIALDLIVPEAAAELREKMQALDLTADVLINNAGFGYKGDFESADADTYASMCNLNVTTLTVLTRTFIPDMMEKGSGGILNVSSMAGIAPVPYFSVYAATKAYVCSFGSALWHEMKARKTGIHVSTLCPGPVETEFFQIAKATPDDVPVRSIQKADEVARIGLSALLRNEMLMPTSQSLSLMQKAASLVPTKLGMSASAAVMKRSKP